MTARTFYQLFPFPFRFVSFPFISFSYFMDFGFGGVGVCRRGERGGDDEQTKSHISSNAIGSDESGNGHCGAADR